MGSERFRWIRWWLGRLGLNRPQPVWRTALVTLTLAALLAALAGAAVLYAGWYNIGATRQHVQIVHSVLEHGMRQSVRHQARDVKVPDLASPDMIQRGALLYRAACAHCHGGPGAAPEDWGKGMQPVPGSLVDAPRKWRPNELYWVTRHGIKMSGMPAWETHLSDAELWAVVAFVQVLPTLTAQRYRDMAAQGGATSQLPHPDSTDAAQDKAVQAPGADLNRLPVQAALGGDAERGRVALTQYACHSCHMIPGVTGSATLVGRPLQDLGKRKLIAGSLPNTHANLVRWIRAPQQFDPQTAMPNMGVSERDARDMAAYLLSR